jgi:uncharacterized phosphosugar-binding protein
LTYAHAYFERAHRLMDEIEAAETSKIEQAATKVAQSVMAGGILHLFGSGHSALPTHEVYIRAGSLTNARPVSLERILDTFERVEGNGLALMKGFDGKPGEVLIVFSNSGVNPLPIEILLEGKRRGLFTVAVSSYDHSLRSEPKHSSGKRLMDLADLSIDSHVPYGDAGLEMPELKMKIGPMSTIAGVSIVNAIIAETIEKIVTAGGEPPVRISRNTPGGDQHNEKFRLLYNSRIPELNL